MPEEPDSKNFKPAERKILVSEDGEPKPAADKSERPVQKTPAVKPLAARPPSAAPVLRMASKPESTPSSTPPPATDKTSFPPNGTADQLPAADLEALHRQYHVPVGKVARKFSPRRRWAIIVLVLVLVGAAVAWFILEPQI